MIYGDSWLSKHLPELVEPFAPEMVNPASYNVRLGRSFLTLKSTKYNHLGDPVEYTAREIGEGQSILIGPGEFMLATTMEKIRVPDDAACFVHGRSSIGRLGLSVQNAGFVDPGFEGHITLELKNETRAPIELVPGYPVAQLVYMQAEGVQHPYHGKYQGQVEATGSMIDKDREKYGKLLPE